MIKPLINKSNPTINENSNKIKRIRGEDHQSQKFSLNADKDQYKAINFDYDTNNAVNPFTKADYTKLNLDLNLITNPNNIKKSNNPIVLKKKYVSTIPSDVHQYSDNYLDTEESYDPYEKINTHFNTVGNQPSNEQPKEKLRIIVKKQNSKGATNSLNIVHQSDLKRKLDELKISTNLTNNSKQSKDSSNINMHIINEDGGNEMKENKREILKEKINEKINEDLKDRLNDRLNEKFSEKFSDKFADINSKGTKGINGVTDLNSPKLKTNGLSISKVTF